MWLKLTGCVIVIGATTVLGLAKARKYALRPRQLRVLQSALQMLETEIIYAATPLPEALERIANRIERDVGMIFLKTKQQLLSGEGYTAPEAWHYAIEETYPDTALSKVDRDILMAFGATLGSSDKEDQTRHLHLAVEQLKREEDKAHEEREKNEKLWKYCGFLVGVVIVLLLY